MIDNDTKEGMNNKCIIDSSILLTLHREPRYVVRLISYIIDKLGQNETITTIKPNVVALESKIDRGDISRGIRRLKELNIIRELDTTGIDYRYIINSDYIFKGDSNFLKFKLNDNESKN